MNTVLTNESRQMRERVVLKQDHVLHTASSAYPGNYPGIDDTWDISQFSKNFKVEVVSISSDRIEFDFIGIDAAIANTFRRILIAEVPTMAIECCYFFNNTSLIPDELLAHRLGLIPLKVDPRLFSYKGVCDEADETNTVVFDLNVVCAKESAHVPEGSSDDRIVRDNVYSSHLQWFPQGSQAEKFPEGLRPVHDDILINKLKPGQEIHVEMHAIKGIGQEHAKWSPVATASYRLMPEIILHKTISGEQAKRLQACFSPGVISINEKGVAQVANARLDTVSREVLRHEEFTELVTLQRVRDHFIFSVETTGAWEPVQIVRQAIEILKMKLDVLHEQLTTEINTE